MWAFIKYDVTIAESYNPGVGLLNFIDFSIRELLIL